MNHSIFAVLLSFLLYNQLLSRNNVGFVEAFVAPRASTEKYLQTTATVAKRTPDPLYLSPSDTPASDVFLLTTGLKGILPQFHQLFGDFNVVSILWGVIAIYSAEFFLILIGFVLVVAPIAECFRPIREYIDKQEDESRQETMKGFLASLVLAGSAESDDASMLDSSYRALSETLPLLDEKEYGDFISLVVEQLMKAERALILRVFEYNLFQYFDESEGLRGIIWHTKSVELSEKLESIMRKDYPGMWQELDEEFLQKIEDPWRPLAFLKCLFDMEKDEDQKSIVQQLFTRTPYEDFLDFTWRSIRRGNKTEDEPSTAA